MMMMIMYLNEEAIYGYDSHLAFGGFFFAGKMSGGIFLCEENVRMLCPGKIFRELIFNG